MELLLNMTEEEQESFMKPEERLAEGDKVKASSRLHRDIDALILLTDFEEPVKVPLRGVKQGVVCYTAGDAAGRGFWRLF